MKKTRKVLCLSVILCMMFASTAYAQEDTSSSVSDDSLETAVSAIEIQEFAPVDAERMNSLVNSSDGIVSDNDMLLRSLSPDAGEPNDTVSDAYPYSSMPEIQTTLTSKWDLYRLGMRTANFHTADDEDWYYANFTSGVTYFVDLRNVGSTNCYIEIYFLGSDNNWYFATTDPSYNSVYANKPEKYFYIQAPTSTTYYIRVSSNGEGASLSMNYFFYVGPAEQTFDIVNMPTYNNVQLLGTGYKTYTLDLTGTAVPPVTEIINLYMADSFPSGGSCTEVDKYMSAGGNTYYNTAGTGSSTINNINGASLGQLWTIGAKCHNNMHSVRWTGVLSGRFRCLMAPYPGNELF